MSLRLCYTKTAFLLWVPDSGQPAGGEFGGGISDIANSFLKLLLMITKNVTVQSDENFAYVEHEEKRYAGCMGRLQQNQSDLIATESLYPAFGHNLTTGPVIYSDKMAFFSYYSNLFPRKHADIMQSFDAFTVTLWIMIILSTLLMMFMITSSQVLARNQRIAIKKWAKQKRWLIQRILDNKEVLRGVSAPGSMTEEKEKTTKTADQHVATFLQRPDPTIH